MEKVSVKRLLVAEFRVAEAIKVLRTNLIFSGVNTRAVALTSYNASEGKSTLALQLAASLAETGKRVVMVDADLRKSALVSRLRHKGKVPGLSHYLTGMANADELLCDTDVPGLYIMFAGQRVPNPAELLGSDGFQRLIPALKQAFDYVIVDAAPLGQVIDCAIMAPSLDGVIMVVDATNNNYRLEQRMKHQLEKSGGRVLGVVLNRVSVKDNPHYYGGEYGYGYGDK